MSKFKGIILMHQRKSLEIFILAMLHFTLHIFQSSLPPIFLLLRTEYDVSFVQIGLITSVSAITSVLQGVAGFLVDRFGRKRVCGIGKLIYVSAIFGYSVASSFWVLLLFVAIAGIGASPFHPATYAMVTERAHESQVGRSVGVHQFGGFIGTAMGTALIAYLSTIFGWRETFRILPPFGIIVVILSWLFVKEEDNIGRNYQETNNDVKISNENIEEEFEFRITPQLMIIYLSGFMSSLGSGTSNFIPTFLSQVYGQSIVTAGIQTSLMLFVGCVSLLAGGIVADRYDKIYIISFFTAMYAVCMIVFSNGLYSPVILLLVLAVTGFFRDFQAPTRHAMTALASSKAGRGRAIGIEFGVIALAGTFAGPLLGYLLDQYGIRMAFNSLTIFLFLSSGIILLLKRWNNWMK